MRRRLFTLASAVSLLLCLATVTLWAVSYWRLDTWGIINQRWDVSKLPYLFSDSASLEFGCARGTLFLHADCGHASHASSAGLQAFDLRDGLRFRHQHYMYAYSYPELMDMYPYAWKWHGVSYLGNGDNPFSKPLGKGYGNRYFAAPAWMACLLLAILPVTFVGRAMRNRALIRWHRCSTCGYNLTGNTSGVCPECGTAIPNRVSR